MDFNQSFYALFILIFLMYFKIFFLKGDHDFIKFIMSLSVICGSMIAKSYFDSDQNNDYSLMILAIPVSVFLIGLSILDLLFYLETKDTKKIIFYGLNNQFKLFFLISNSIVTLIYVYCLFKWF
jgi:hypothetical protein